MKIQLLREFIMLSESLNFTRAAQKMNITQPVLSRHMKEMEEIFGTELFRRDTHKVALTSAGELLFSEVRKVIQQYDSSVSVMRTFTGQSRHSLSITFLGEAIRQLLVELVDNFQRQHQEVMVDCRDSELDEALVLLEEGQCDLGFLIRPNFMAQRENFCSLPFQTDPLCVAVNRHHPLAGRGRVSLREVVDWPVIRVDPREFAQSEHYSTHFLRRHGFEFSLYKEYSNLKSCCFNLELNRSVVLLMPKHRGYLLGKNSVLLELEEADCGFVLELVWVKQNLNPSASLFIREFRAFLGNDMAG
ncbi:LysR family transcriptional regulator [Musicola paradisiaca]|uniref:Transcriptional regulator, LysR family n=1 Tax=Musicola paradisiaca (strain Ech703) TaxID=579405 RepID=C6CDQ4_MUSP7|nr:LysR family transcriptional regulator [Musicola paradisiaca]ACS85171.1 transcriptional regulator, LysR family [Musicola paradisiaca Ech703]